MKNTGTTLGDQFEGESRRVLSEWRRGEVVKVGVELDSPIVFSGAIEGRGRVLAGWRSGFWLGMRRARTNWPWEGPEPGPFELLIRVRP